MCWLINISAASYSAALQNGCRLLRVRMIHQNIILGCCTGYAASSMHAMSLVLGNNPAAALLAKHIAARQAVASKLHARFESSTARHIALGA